jgi:hypothetical protein
VPVADLIVAQLSGHNLEEIGGKGCNMEAVMMECADHIAALHLAHWMNRKLLT